MKFYYSQEIEGHVVGRWVKMINYYKILVGNSKGKGLLEVQYLDNIKMDHKEAWCKGINIFLGQGWAQWRIHVTEDFQRPAAWASVVKHLLGYVLL